MATWQQGINSGGFLAGIGAQNENAPKASDINTTLGLIRENNELARSGANNASSIAAPATSAANAQNYEMKKDLDAISGASIDDLGFMTGIHFVTNAISSGIRIDKINRTMIHF